MREDLLQWITAQAEFDTFITVTLVQGTLSADGHYVSTTRSDVDRTAWIFRDRVSKRLLGSSAHRRGERFAWVTFVENGGGEKRWHLHIVCQRPASISEVDFGDAVQAVCLKMHEVRGVVDIRPIQPRDNNTDGVRAVVAYSLKEGTGAFCPAATYLPSNI